MKAPAKPQIPAALRLKVATREALGRIPDKGARPLAAPPSGSDLRPVMGQPGPPVVGHSLDVFTDTLEFCREGYRRHGTVFWTSATGTKFAMVLGPDAIEKVLANRDKEFASGPAWGYFIGAFFDRGVMLMDFEEHRHHRRIMQEAFKRPRLESYLEMMNSTIDRGVAKWQPQSGFKLYAAAKQLTLDIATEVFVGGELGPEADRIDRAFINTVTGGQAVVRRPIPGGKWHRGLKSRALLDEYFRSQLGAKRRGDANDLFSVLCRAETEDGDRFSDDDVVNHMIFVLMAAHDTSTITLAMMGYYLARHPEWQDRLRAESQTIGKTTLSMEDFDRLPAMELAFKETLRMNSPVGVVARSTTKDTEIDGYFLPRGTKMMLGLYPTMRMEPWWSDPDRFDPERFSDERREDLSHKFAWTPFGGNVHKCIGMHFGGMEVKAIMHRLLLEHSWTIPDGYEPVIDYGTGPFPADELPIELRRL